MGAPASPGVKEQEAGTGDLQGASMSPSSFFQPQTARREPAALQLLQEQVTEPGKGAMQGRSPGACQ